MDAFFVPRVPAAFFFSFQKKEAQSGLGRLADRHTNTA